MPADVALPTVEQVSELPLLLERSIPPEYEDANGHIHVTRYLDLHDQAWTPFVELAGMSRDRLAQRRSGIFDVEHHLRYLAEVLVGDTVAVHARLLARSTKAIHGLWFLVNLTREQIANTFEFTALHVDLGERRTVPFDSRVASALDELVERDAALRWDPPVCGVMGVSRS